MFHDFWEPLKLLGTNGAKYSRMDQAKFVKCRPYPFKFFKGCLPQILLRPFLNTLFQIVAHFKHEKTLNHVCIFMYAICVRKLIFKITREHI